MTGTAYRTPSVSVVIPLYNKADDVSRAVLSVLAQSVSDFELIVVNDGSTDGGETVVARLEDPRIRIVNQRNAGDGAARNRGVLEASGELIAFCDADDEWMPAFLETVIRLAERFPQCDVLATSYVIRERDGLDFAAPVVSGGHGGLWEGVLEDYFATASKSGTPWLSSCVAVKRDAMMAVGGFPTGVKVGADLLGWARLASAYEIAISTSPQAIFYLRGAFPAAPVRTPELPDTVGAELARMAAAAPSQRQPAMRRYAGMWHRVRAMMFVYHGRRSDAFRELRKALRYSPADSRIYALSVLALMPTGLSDRALGAITRWKATPRRLT